ncbi:MAG TPA: aminoglycoside phosphotransferase family protein [Mycobacteriales bacterium]|nr:aminoglycoside phosphotransferase family protein [Mycobacteriales bacterium]
MSAALRIPPLLRAAAEDDERDDWLAALPGVVKQAADHWGLEIAAPYEPGGECAWVAPARTPDGADVVVKVGWPHPESEHESAGLALWAGEGVVRLLDDIAADSVQVLLLERCLPGAALSHAADPAKCDDVIAGLLLRLRRRPPAAHPFRPLAVMCAEWADAAGRRLITSVLPDRELIRTGIALFRTLPQTATEQVVLFTDLHSDNVLAAQREPWLAIDPKPYVGDPCYDVLQHLLNTRLAQDPRGAAERMAGLAELDAPRVREWLFARCAIEAVDEPSWFEVVRALAP